MPTSLWTGAWVQAEGPSKRCRHVVPGATWGSLCPANQTSCAEAPSPWPPPYHSRLDRSRLGPVRPSDRNLIGRGGDGGGDGGQGRPMRGHGWAGRREVSEVSSWLPPPTRALISLLLSSPSKDGESEGRGQETRRNKMTKNRDAGEKHRNIGFIRPILKSDKMVMTVLSVQTYI